MRKLENGKEQIYYVGDDVHTLCIGATRSGKETAVEQIADGVLLMSNDKEILLAVSAETAKAALSEAAVGCGIEKGDYLCYPGAMTAIPLYELSRVNEGVREHIVSEESLRATLCGNYPEYVKTYNMSAPPDARIEDADAPPYLFLQKQLDNEADNTRSEVHAYQDAHAHEADRGFERLPHEELEL